MSRISFLTIVSYLEILAINHVDVKKSFRWNLSEISGSLRTGTNLPVMLIDAVETNTSGDSKKTIRTNTTAITVLGKPNTKTGDLDQYQAQNQVLDFCQQICFDFEERILEDAKEIKDINGVKNWLYGLVDKNSFHCFKVGPLFSDGLYGYRLELSIKASVKLCVDKTKWTDLP